MTISKQLFFTIEGKKLKFLWTFKNLFCSFEFFNTVDENWGCCSWMLRDKMLLMFLFLMFSFLIRIISAKGLSFCLQKSWGDWKRWKTCMNNAYSGFMIAVFGVVWGAEFAGQDAFAIIWLFVDFEAIFWGENALRLLRDLDLWWLTRDRLAA